MLSKENKAKIDVGGIYIHPKDREKKEYYLRHSKYEVLVNKNGDYFMSDIYWATNVYPVTDKNINEWEYTGIKENK